MRKIFWVLVPGRICFGIETPPQEPEVSNFAPEAIMWGRSSGCDYYSHVPLCSHRRVTLRAFAWGKNRPRYVLTTAIARGDATQHCAITLTAGWRVLTIERVAPRLRGNTRRDSICLREAGCVQPVTQGEWFAHDPGQPTRSKPSDR